MSLEPRFFPLALLVCGLLPIEFELEELPAIVSVYDPALGGINCDSDCTHFATGIDIGPQHYGNVAACPAELLGGSVSFAGIGEFYCLDTGGAIGRRWSSYYNREVVAFDILWHLEDDNAVPWWAYGIWPSWEFTYN